MYIVRAAMRLPLAVAPVFILLAAATAIADDDVPLAKAYTFAAEGLRAYDEGRPEEALSKFSAAYSIVRLPSIALFMARAQAKLGHLIAASKLCDEAVELQDGIGDPDVQRRAREEAKAERDEIDRRTPRLLAVIAGAPASNVQVQLDTSVLLATPLLTGIPLDPGTHSISATYGTQRRQFEVSLVERQPTTITLDFTLAPVLPKPAGTEAKLPETQTHPWQAATWVSFGLGGAALALWGTTGLWAVSKSRDLDRGGTWSVDNCAGSSDQSKCNDYRHLRTLSTVGFYAGLAGVATGTTLLIISPKPKQNQRSGIRLDTFVGFGSVNLKATF